jgi:hypothetical protein
MSPDVLHDDARREIAAKQRVLAARTDSDELKSVLRELRIAE